ncbi:MAG: type IV secretion system DNA-binding domain-containing protein [Armatimonadetes bacterium]|nr:type IV secretion system DNA-binding domain-containing protein [Armatimonadota bacterium]
MTGPRPGTRPAAAGVHVGRYLSSPGGGAGLRFLCDAPELLPHADKPWLRAWAAERLGLPPAAPDGPPPPAGRAEVGQDLLARHACVCGATGSGKTRLALRLLEGQLRVGCSAVMLDPKAETIRHLMQIAFSCGLSPEQVTVLSPHLSGAGAPGWNPLDAKASGVPPVQAAADVVGVLERSTSSWGPRMADLLTNALVVVASHGLSLFELARLLQRDDYREALLARPLPGGGKGSDPLDAVAYQEAHDYFLSEFAAWSGSERAAAAAPALNKFRELLRSPFLRALLCARRTTLRLGELWRRQGLVLVHLDSAALGDEGARLLGGLLAHQLLRTAMRADGPVPVALALDEMGVSEEFVGSAASKILALARSRNLRLLVACQHLSQLSDGLRAALLANAAVQAFFRLGYADARLAAGAIAAGTGERVERVAVDVARRGAEGEPEAWATIRHVVRDGRGEPVALSPAAAAAFRDLTRNAEWRDDGAAQVEALLRLARMSGEGRLYVHAADTKAPAELRRYVRGLAPDDHWLEIGGREGAGPVTLAVSFPRPRLSVVSRETEAERERAWTRELASLPVRHAALRLAGGAAAVVEVAKVPDPSPPPGFERFVSGAVASGGQTAREVAEAQQGRRDEVERVAGGASEHGEAGAMGPEARGAEDVGRLAGRAASPAGNAVGNRPRGRKATTRQAGREGLTAPSARPALSSAPAGTVAEDGSLA